MESSNGRPHSKITRKWTIEIGLGAFAVLAGAFAALAMTPEAHADNGTVIPGTDIPTPTTYSGIVDAGQEIQAELQNAEAAGNSASDLATSVQLAGSVDWMSSMNALTNSQVGQMDVKDNLFPASDFEYASKQAPLFADEGQFEQSMIGFFQNLTIPSQGENNGTLTGALQDALQYQGDINSTISHLDSANQLSQLTELTDDNLSLSTFDGDLVNEANWIGDVDLLAGL